MHYQTRIRRHLLALDPHSSSHYLKRNGNAQMRQSTYTSIRSKRDIFIYLDHLV
jgi:hypothetical protein